MAERLFRAIGRADMVDDLRFRTNTDRVNNIDEADRPLAEYIKARTLAERLAAFEAAEVTAAPVYDIGQFIADPHVQARQIVTDLPDPEMGRCRCMRWCRGFRGRRARFELLRLRLASITMRYSVAWAERRGDGRFAQMESHMSDATDRKLPVWRSALYVPADVPRFIDGAHRRGADAIIVDLEDSVPIADDRRRGATDGDGRERFARRGRRDRAHQPAMAAGDARPRGRNLPRVKALAVTKVDSADHIRLIAES